MLVSRLLCAATAAAALSGAAPASAQFYFKGPDIAGPRVTGEEPGILAQQLPGATPVDRLVRFRSLGCYPLSAAVESSAATLEDIVDEMRSTRTSERAGRLIDKDSESSMEMKKREGYF